MSRVVVLALYRNKLRQCVSLGYTYGSWDHTYICNDHFISKRKLSKLYQRDALGHHIFNNVRHYYKLMATETHDETRDNLIDYGFSILRVINGLTDRLRGQRKALPAT